MIKLIFAVVVFTATVFGSVEGGPRGRLIDLLNAERIGCADSLQVAEYTGREMIYKEGIERAWVVTFIDRCRTTLEPLPIQK